MRNKPQSYHIGNILIAISLTIFVYICYPIVQVYLFPPHIQPVSHYLSNGITIPKIHAQAPIIDHVDPFDPAVYDQALKKGVAHAEGTAEPGQKGTVYLFAHSSGLPWEVTHMNTIFLRLGELEPKDQIIIMYKSKVYHYVVVDKKEVDPSQVQYLTNTDRNQLILQTCTPIGTSLRRLLVFADPQ
jgi:sortase A